MVKSSKKLRKQTNDICIGFIFLLSCAFIITLVIVNSRSYLSEDIIVGFIVWNWNDFVREILYFFFIPILSALVLVLFMRRILEKIK